MYMILLLGGDIVILLVKNKVE